MPKYEYDTYYLHSKPNKHERITELFARTNHKSILAGKSLEELRRMVDVLHLNDEACSMFSERLNLIEGFISDTLEEIDWYCDTFNCREEVDWKLNQQKKIDAEEAVKEGLR